MSERTIDEQLVKYLTDVHSIEEQALVQMKMAPKIAGNSRLEAIFSQHETETEQQKDKVRDRLDAHGAAPSKVKDVVGQVTGIGFGLFAKFQPDTPGKLVSHAYSYEHMEIAAYELLARVAERAGDEETVRAANEIRDEERRMADRLEGSFELAAEESLREKDAESMDDELNAYLRDAHSIEGQAIQMLEHAKEIAGTSEIGALYEEHLEETREHQRLIAERLEARGSESSLLKDTAMRLGALNWGGFFHAQPDTPAKLAGFAFAFEHLEIGGYEQLRRVARAANDPETLRVAETILAEEREAAEKIAAHWDEAIQASLEDQGVSAERVTAQATTQGAPPS